MRGAPALPPLAKRLFPALIALILVIIGIICRPLIPIDETRYLTVSWEMHLDHDWLVSHLNGAPYNDKPPLLFWLINLVWALGGIAEFPARLIGPAFAAASIALTGLLARRLWPDQPDRAGAAALILAVSPVWVLFGSTTMFDAMLTCAALLAMLALWSAAQRPRRAAWVALGAAVAFGVYAKGPVILLHVLPAAFTMPLWAGPARSSGLVWARGLGLALLVALLLVGLWLIPALILGGAEYRTEVLWRQSGGRIVNVAARPALEPRLGAGMTAYTIAKSGVAALTIALAEEVAKQGILVNAVAPSIMDTPANRAAMPKADFDKWPKVEDVAATILFLASPGNTVTRGAIVPVYGKS